MTSTVNNNRFATRDTSISTYPSLALTYTNLKHKRSFSRVKKERKKEGERKEKEREKGKKVRKKERKKENKKFSVYLLSSTFWRIFH